ncbi:MAG: hypothetical protein Q4B59_05830 [Lachnospiraceae bacterium]|nr:hypothetical protein [Lachnospiraceae bacterium]
MHIRERQFLEADIPIFKREIQTLYQKFDRQFGLHGAQVPIRFKFDESVLGSYTQAGNGEKEHFTFSLIFLGYLNKNPMHRLDKQDLYAHEYAHYMQVHYDIPREHLWKSGQHGSAWMYCCSLVGAAPTPYYRIGEGRMKHDYQKALYNPMADPNYAVRDRLRQEKSYRDQKNSQVKYQIGEQVEHPTFGPGIVEAIRPMTGSVQLTIRFGQQIKVIDQKWLLRTRYSAPGRK